MPGSPSCICGNVISSLYLIDEWCEGKGQVFPEWAVKLTRKGKDWVPIPEILYVSYERLSPEWIADEFCPVLPDLVIEIISPIKHLVNSPLKLKII